MTVEAEEVDNQSRSSSRVNTMKVPLNDVGGKSTAAKGTPKRRGRPRKSEDLDGTDETVQDSDLVVKRLRRSGPSRKARRQSGLVNEILPNEIDDTGERADTEQNVDGVGLSSPRKKRGRPRKSVEAMPPPMALNARSDAPGKTTSKKKTQPSRNSLSSPLQGINEETAQPQQPTSYVEDRIREDSLDNLSIQGSSHGSDAMSFSGEVGGDIATVDLAETTAELDRSAMESEGFTLVSLDTLRSQHNRTDREDTTELELNDREPLHQSTERTESPIEERRHLSPKNPEVRYPTLPNVRSTASSEQPKEVQQTSSDLHSSGPSGTADHNKEHQPSTNRKSKIFEAYGENTQRELRGDLLAGEKLASHQHSSPQGAGMFGRLPTPADSVNLSSQVAGVGSSSDARHHRSEDEMSWRPTTMPRPVMDKLSSDLAHYDEMSWRPDSPQMARDLRNTNIETVQTAEEPTLRDADIWRDEADRSVDDSLEAPRARQRRRRNEQELHKTQPAEKDPRELVHLPVKRPAPPEEDESSAQRFKKTKIRPFSNNEAQESPIPSISEFVASDDRPPRGKIPRTWRRTSDSGFLYSDETEESPQVQQSNRKIPFNSPGTPFDILVPSVFRRLGFGKRSGAIPKRNSPEQNDSIAEEQEEAHETTEPVEEGDPPASSLPLQAQPCKSILASPERRSASPAKSVQWHNDDSLVETHVESTEHSTQPLLSSYDEATFDSPRSSNNRVDAGSDSGEDADVDTFFTPAHGATFNDGTEGDMADAENENDDDTMLKSSPLNVKTSTSLRYRDQTFGSTASTATDLPTDTESSDEDDIPTHAQQMSQLAAASRPNLPDTRTQSSRSRPNGLLARITNFLFVPTITTPLTPTDPTAPRPGPHVWTRQHMNLMLQWFNHLPLLDPRDQLWPNPDSQRWELNYTQGDPSRLAPLPNDFFVRPLDIPAHFLAEVGKTYSTTPGCDRGAVCGPHCPGVPRICRYRIYSRTMKETDVRVAFAVACHLLDRGLTILDGQPWEAVHRRAPVLDAHGRKLRKHEDWMDDRAARSLCWRVFGCWVALGMERTVERARQRGQGEAGVLLPGEGWGGELWREREAWGL